MFFYLAGRALIPHLGIQNDEALFAAGIYDPATLPFRWVFGHRVPIMLMSYLGTLKCWIYAGLFQIWPPTASSIRVPMLLAGVASVWLFFLLMRRISGSRAALIGALLLAADTGYLLTICFDWGPVALQHLLLLGGMLLLVRFCQTPGWPSLAGGFFLLGLAIWDKALFSWVLGGLAVATLVVLPRQVLRMATVGRAAVALAAFCLGALPLILHNAKYEMVTFRTNANWAADDLRGKSQFVRYTLEGRALFGWLMREDAPSPITHRPGTRLARASAWLSAATGQPHRSLQVYAFVLALLLFVWLGWREGWSPPVRVLVFTLVFMAVVWIQMALTKGAGGSIHHVILLWPAPQAFMAVAFATAGRYLGRRGTVLTTGVVVVVVCSGLLVTNQSYTLMIRNGGALNWTDAVYPLNAYLERTPARYVFVTDWGILDTLRLLSRGRIRAVVGSDPLTKPSPGAADLETLRTWLASPENLFVTHTEGNEFFVGTRAKLLKLAPPLGYRPELLRVVEDGWGRPMFEVFRFAPLKAAL